MEGPTFHRLAKIISAIEQCFNLYIIRICSYGVGCFENTLFQWNHGDKTYQHHPCSGKLNIQNGDSEFGDVHIFKEFTLQFPEEIYVEIHEMMKVEAFAFLVASFGLFFSYGLFKVGICNSLLAPGDRPVNLSENLLWHIFKNVCLIVMSLGVILNDFSRLLRNNSGIDNNVSGAKSFVIMLMIFGVIFPMLATIFDWRCHRDVH